MGYLSRASDKPPPSQQLDPNQPDRATNIVAPAKTISNQPQKIIRSSMQYNDNSGGFTNLLQRYLYSLNLIFSFRRLTNAARKQQDEQTTLITRTANDYGYIPPGYGLNGNLKSAMSALAGPCACHNPNFSLPIDQHSPESEDHTNRVQMEYSMLTTSEDQALPPANKPKTKEETLALQIDRYSAIFFPAVFALFNVSLLNKTDLIRVNLGFLLVSLFGMFFKSIFNITTFRSTRAQLFQMPTRYLRLCVIVKGPHF